VNVTNGRKIKSTSSNEVLESAFLDAVIISEGISDQFVYENAFRNKHILEECSYRFISTWGKENIADDFRFFKSLNISFAAILDYDAIFSSSRRGLIERCLEELQVNDVEREALLTELQEIREFSKGMPYRDKGLNCPSLSEENKKRAGCFLDKLKEKGIFIVPVGCLEDWVNESKPISPEKILAKYKHRSNSEFIGLTNFLKEIEGYIKRGGI
jgi:hypothetical protein